MDARLVAACSITCGGCADLLGFERVEPPVHEVVASGELLAWSSADPDGTEPDRVAVGSPVALAFAGDTLYVADGAGRVLGMRGTDTTPLLIADELGELRGLAVGDAVYVLTASGEILALDR